MDIASFSEVCVSDLNGLKSCVYTYFGNYETICIYCSNIDFQC